MKDKKNKPTHTADTKYGMGDFYGSGVTQRMGKVKTATFEIKRVNNSAKKKPTSLA